MVDCCYGDSIALKKDGTVWVWGLNDSGQLGTGDKKNRLKPTKIMSLTKVSDESYSKPTYYIDSNLTDWENVTPIYQNTEETSSNNQPFLQEIYFSKGKKYLYIVVKATGEKPELHIEFDNNGDGDADYSADFSIEMGLIWINQSIGKDKWKAVSELQSFYYDNNTFEIRIPLSQIGTPKKISAQIGVLYKDGTYISTNEYLSVK